MPARILIADDHEHIRNLIRAFIQDKLGHLVCGEAVDGHDALVKARRLKPDLIVLKLSLPDMNATEAAPKLKEVLPRTPIVLFTLYGELLRGLAAQEMGVDAVVSLDRGVEMLGETVKQLLRPAR